MQEKTVQIHFRATEKERLRFKVNAHKCGLSISEYLRKLASDYIRQRTEGGFLPLSILRGYIRELKNFPLALPAKINTVVAFRAAIPAWEFPADSVHRLTPAEKTAGFLQRVWAVQIVPLALDWSLYHIWIRVPTAPTLRVCYANLFGWERWYPHLNWASPLQAAPPKKKFGFFFGGASFSKPIKDLCIKPTIFAQKI